MAVGTVGALLLIATGGYQSGYILLFSGGFSALSLWIAGNHHYLDRLSDTFPPMKRELFFAVLVSECTRVATVVAGTTGFWVIQSPDQYVGLAFVALISAAVAFILFACLCILGSVTKPKLV